MVGTPGGNENRRNHPDGEKSSQTEIEYRLAWARTYLKKYGILENSDRGIWLIVPERRDVKSVDPQVVVKTVRDEHKKQKEAIEKEKTSEEDADTDIEIPDEAESWRSSLHHVLIHEISPDAFEPLTVTPLLLPSALVPVASVPMKFPATTL